MSLDEILQLDKVQSSVKKIDLFVSQKTKFSKDYMKAIAYKGLVLHELGKTNDALKLLYEYVPDINKMDSEGVIALCSSIVDVTISIGAYDQAAKYIRIKQKYLPISRQSEYIKDSTRLYLAKCDYENAKQSLKEYLDDDITREEEIFALEKLSDIYYMERDYDKYLELIPRLESYYATTLDLSHQEEIAKNKIEIAFIRKNYIRVIQDGDSFFNEYDASIDKKLLIASYMIKSYILVDNYKKASIVESNYEEYITIDYPKESLEFAKAALDLYIHTNTASSIISYRRKIEELEDVLNPKEDIKKVVKKSKKKEEIVIPTIEEKEEVTLPLIKAEDTSYSPLGILNPKVVELPLQSQKVIEDIKTVKNITVSENYSKLSIIFDTMNQVDHNVKFREAFRRASIEIANQYSIKEIYLLYFDYKYLGLHYKVERVYDKEPKVDLLEGTLGYQAMQMGREVFLDLSDKTYSKSIVTGKDFISDTYAIAIPLFDNNRELGSITYLSDTPFLSEDLCYESLKLITSVLNTKLIEYLDREKNDIKNSKMLFIQENMSLGVIEKLEGYYHFSDKAQEILGVLETLTDKDYFMHMESSDVIKYKEILKELYALKSKDIIFEYDFKKGNSKVRVKERFYPLLDNGMIIIYSLIEDITDLKKEKDDLVALAYENPISHMQTEVKLTVDLAKEYSKKKLSLVIIDVIDSLFYKDIYGLNFYNQVIYAVGIKLKDAFSNHFNIELYHLFGTTYAVLIRDINDKRIVDSILKSALDNASLSMKQLNYRVNIRFNAGVFRLGKNMNFNDIHELIENASDALIDASNMDSLDNHIAHYDSHLAKERFYQNHLVTAISEAIDQGKLSLMYKQIVNLTGNKVLGFYLEISMDTLEISKEDMDNVIKKKGLVSNIEKYMLRMAYQEMRLFNNETKAYPNLFIPVSKETLEEKYLESLATNEKFYKVNPKYITLVTDSIHNTCLESLRDTNYHLASKDIFDVYRGLCDYLIYDYHGVNSSSIPEILELCEKHNVTVILSNMDSSIDIDMARENGYQYIFGNYYNKRFRIKDLLQGVKRRKN